MKIKKTIFLSLIVLINAIVVVYAFAPLFITFAQLPVEGVNYVVGNKKSIEKALFDVKYGTMSEVYKLWTRNIFSVIYIIVADLIIIGVLLFKKATHNHAIKRTENASR